MSRTIAKHNWHAMSLVEKRDYIPIGSVFYIQHGENRPYARRDTFRLEWGTKGKNRGTLTVHGTEEQARALMTHAYMSLRIAEDAPDRETVQAFLKSFCRAKESNNQHPQWEIIKDIPIDKPKETQYMRAESFLRSLLIRTLRNIYYASTGEDIK